MQKQSSKREIKIAGHWPNSFLRFYGMRQTLDQQKRKIERGQYPAILTEHAE